MIEHRVEYYAHAARLARRHEPRERLVAAEMRVDVVVIAYVVLMIRHGREDRSQIQRVHAEPYQIIELLPYPVEIAARKALGRGLCAPFQIDIRRIAVAAAVKPVYEYLINDRARKPIDARHNVAAIDESELKEIVVRERKIVALGRAVLRKVILLAVAGFEQKYVCEPFVCKFQPYDEVVEKIVGQAQFHARRMTLRAKKMLYAVQNIDAFEIVFRRAKPYLDGVVVERKAVQRIGLVI